VIPGVADLVFHVVEGPRTAYREEEIINQRNLAALDQFVPPGGVNHTLPPGMPQEANLFLGQYLNAFPDVKATVED